MKQKRKCFSSNVGISYQRITGVKNPVLTLSGTKKNKKIDIKVYCDDKEMPIEYYNVENDKDFYFTATLNRKSKFLFVYAIVDKEKKELLIKSRMHWYKRLLSKIKSECIEMKNKFKIIFVTFKKGFEFLWKEYHFLVPPKLWKKYFLHFINRIREQQNIFWVDPNNVSDYNNWIKKYEKKSILKTLKYNPLMSILIPVYNIDKNSLSECLNSILNQSYKNFEICIVDDCSSNFETIDTLKKYELADDRIKVKYRKKNGHISKATNDALSMAKGEYIVLVDDDDIISEDALYCVAEELNKNNKLDFIYSDEDKIDLFGRRCFPNFKPDWSPDTLLSMNYICHMTTIRKKIVDDVGGFRVGYEGAQDYDLFLRVTEKTKNIYHIPKVLYHWRMVEGSTSMVLNNKSYALENGKKAIEDALKRRKIKATVLIDQDSKYYKILYSLKKVPLVSIIIPTKDYAETTRICLNSLFSNTSYSNYEVILVNNNSIEEETYVMFDEFKKKYNNFKVIDANYEFNYSKINNEAVKFSSGEYLCLLNNDTDIVEPNWLTYMVGYASQKHVGTVGAKLLYPDNTVQHAGTIIGFGGVASHSYIGMSSKALGDFGRLCVPYNYAANTAACLVIKKDKFLSVGGLEENLKVAYNDVDLNLKLLDSGLYNVFVPMAVLHHFESKSRGFDTTSEKYKRFKSEESFMYNKWDKYIKNDPFYNINYSKKGWFKLDK